MKRILLALLLISCNQQEPCTYTCYYFSPTELGRKLGEYFNQTGTPIFMYVDGIDYTVAIDSSEANEIRLLELYPDLEKIKCTCLEKANLHTSDNPYYNP